MSLPQDEVFEGPQINWTISNLSFSVIFIHGSDLWSYFPFRASGISHQPSDWSAIHFHPWTLIHDWFEITFEGVILIYGGDCDDADFHFVPFSHRPSGWLQFKYQYQVVSTSRSKVCRIGGAVWLCGAGEHKHKCPSLLLSPNHVPSLQLEIR